MAKSLVIGSFPSKAAQTGIQNGSAHKSFNYGWAPDFPEVLSTIISHSAPYHYFSQSQSFCWEEEVGLLFLLNISKHSTKSLSGYKEALMSFWKPFSFLALQRKINYSFSQQISRKHEVLMENFIWYFKLWSAPGILFVSSYLDEFYLLAQLAVCSEECCLKALYLPSVLNNKEPSLDQIGSLTHNSNAITIYKIPSRHHKKCRSAWWCKW